MGAKQSTMQSGSSLPVGCVPTYQTLRLVHADLHGLFLPERTVQAWQIGNGDFLFIRDTRGNLYKCAVQFNGSEHKLVTGWIEMLKKFDCRCGDQLLFKHKEGNTWKVRVFSGVNDREKFPVIEESSWAYPSNESSIAYHAPSPVASSRTIVTAPVIGGALGSIGRPIAVDDQLPTVMVYNASSRLIDDAKRYLLEKISRTYAPRIPLYYTDILAINTVTGFLQICSVYGRKYIVPMLETTGNPDDVVLFLNGSNDDFPCRFAAIEGDGAVALYDGLDDFLICNQFEHGAEAVLHFDFSTDGYKIYIHRI